MHSAASSSSSEAEPPVELVVVPGPELLDRLAVDPRRIEEDRVQVLVGERPARLLEPAAALAVGLVRELDAQHPERDRLAVDGCLELGLDRREPFLVRAGEAAEEALAREAPELDRRALEPLRGLEPRQLRVAFVDRVDLERRLVARVVLVPLALELGEEEVGRVAEGVELAVGGGGRRHGP